MGVVYLAQQLKLGRRVALKVMAAELSGDEGYKARFQREARLAAALDHPHVIPLFETGEAAGLLYLAMRYVEGTDLAALLPREGPLEPGRAALIGRQVGAALDAAHAQGLIHRDVKPANILLSEQDGELHAYLTDFGIAKDSAANTQLTHTGEWVGTLDYIAPEVLDRRRVDARADIYSLGCVLFQMLTGRVPYVGTSIQKMWGHANEPAPSVGELNPRVPTALDAVVARAMAKEPDDRFPSAGDLGRAAQAAVTGTTTALAERSVAVGAAATGAPDSLVPIRPAPEPGTVRLARSGGRWRRLAIPAAVILIVLGAAAAVLIAGGGGETADEPSPQATGNARTATETSPERTTTSQAAEPSEPATAPNRPERYVSYTPPTFGYAAEIPAGAGWSRPAESEPTPNRLYRTTVRGPEGFVLIVDYTPHEPAAFGGDFDARRQLTHPFFGSMTEYVFSGGRFPQCADSTCVDYIINDEDGGFGYGVLGGGTDDPGLARDVTRHVADSLTYEG
jgi:hypothetical protein